MWFSRVETDNWNSFWSIAAENHRYFYCWNTERTKFAVQPTWCNNNRTAESKQLYFGFSVYKPNFRATGFSLICFWRTHGSITTCWRSWPSRLRFQTEKSRFCRLFSLFLSGRCCPGKLVNRINLGSWWICRIRCPNPRLYLYLIKIILILVIILYYIRIWKNKKFAFGNYYI